MQAGRIARPSCIAGSRIYAPDMYTADQCAAIAAGLNPTDDWYILHALTAGVDADFPLQQGGVVYAMTTKLRWYDCSYGMD